jgi:hypothetical protein
MTAVTTTTAFVYKISKSSTEDMAIREKQSFIRRSSKVDFKSEDMRSTRESETAVSDCVTTSEDRESERGTWRLLPWYLYLDV